MFILELTYAAPLDRVDALLPAHLSWLEQHYADGTFLASGRKVPRDGGIILAVAPDRPTIEAIAATDPFVPAAVATYRITEFLATTVAPALAPHRETLPA
ncbi:YciI family protein [Kitasatospora phosalacinea]|uniref:YciI family protein n=1 Tax=Kitasatospora phosalacinea TaxID=2065 RepID=UPI0035DE30AB